MAFTAADVKTLREMTSVGMMDCKKALVECDGDMDKAVEWLREKGLAKAAKKAGRIAAEGMSYALTENGVGVVVEVNCETDFCAKSDLFVAFVKDIAKVIAEQDPADVDALMNCKYVGSDLTVSETMPEKVMSIGENLQIRRFVRFSENTSVGYVHAGGKNFGCAPHAAAEVTRAVKAVTKKPVFMKLSPNVTDIAEIARACADAGADGICLINTLLGMRIDLKRRRPLLANTTGGMSGPGMFPLAVRMVYQVAQAVKVPIIGMGGIASAEDALEVILAGRRSSR